MIVDGTLIYGGLEVPFRIDGCTAHYSHATVPPEVAGPVTEALAAMRDGLWEAMSRVAGDDESIPVEVVHGELIDAHIPSYAFPDMHGGQH